MVHCSVCGRRLYEQTDTFEGFPSSPSFNGWDRREHATRAVISDTCEDCHAQLLAAVVEVANKIVAANQEAWNQRRAELVAWQEQEKEYARCRDAFEREWRARQPDHR